MHDNQLAVMVCFHDLVGFGSMISPDTGTFTSEAIDRLENMRLNKKDVSMLYPENTSFHIINDSVTANSDLDKKATKVDFQKEKPPLITHFNPARAIDVIRFFHASLKLHLKTFNSEESKGLGGGARTFIVLGFRWKIGEDESHLHANTAFAEAYKADDMGSKAGFIPKPVENCFFVDGDFRHLLASSFDYAKRMASFTGDGEKVMDSILKDISTIKSTEIPSVDLLDCKEKPYLGVSDVKKMLTAVDTLISMTTIVKA